MSFRMINASNNCIYEVVNIDKAAAEYGLQDQGTQNITGSKDTVRAAFKVELIDLAKVENEIDDLFLPYTFDISIFSDIDNQDLIEHINRVGIIFYDHSARSVQSLDLAKD